MSPLRLPRAAVGRVRDAGKRAVATATAVVVVIGVAVGVTAAGSGGSGTRHLTAYFSRTIGIYSGNDVRILGIKVGKIDSITPDGTQVKVVMSYDAAHPLPEGVDAVIIPPSVVSDRYIQLTPAYTGGQQLSDHAVLGLNRTMVPLEFDEIFANINQLDVALGPNGANAKGALSNLISVSAKNLQGNGELLNGALKEFSDAIATVSNSRTDLFDTVSQLQQFTTTLAQDDGGIRALNTNLEQVGTQLAGERQDFGAALENLSTALDLVNTFVANNKATLTTDVTKLTQVSQVLYNERAAITQIVDDAPVALTNLALAGDPAAQTLDTKDDAQEPATVPGPVCDQLLGALADTPIPVSPVLSLPLCTIVSSGAASQIGSTNKPSTLLNLLRGER